MGHSTNILSLRAGLTFKWRVFFISSHYYNYYFDYTYYYLLLRNYLHYICRFKYSHICIKFSMLFGAIRINLKNFYTPNVRVYFYDLFYLRFFKKFFKIMRRSLFVKRIRYIVSGGRRARRRRRRRRFFRKKWVKRRYFVRAFDFFFENYAKKKFVYGDFKNKFFLKKHVFSFLPSLAIKSLFKQLRLVILSFFVTGFFFKKPHFIKLRRKVKQFFKFRFFLKFFKFKKFFFSQKNFDDSVGHLKKRFNFSLKTLRKFLLKRKLRFYYKRRKKRLDFFFFNFKLQLLFMFKNFFFIRQKKKLFLNFKFFFFLFYILYIGRLKKLIKRRKFRRSKQGKLFYKNNRLLKFNFYYLFGIFFAFLKEIRLNKILVFKFLKYLFIKFLRKMWFYLIWSTFKKLYKFYYLQLRRFFFFKIKKLFFGFKLNVFNLKLKTFNCLPLSFSTIYGNFVLLYFRWKLNRRFTLNQTVWPFIRRLKKYNKMFIRGFFFKGSGRFNRKQRSDLKKYFFGRVQFSTYQSRVSYHFLPIITKYGTCGLKIWFSFNKKHLNRTFNRLYKINIL